MITGVVVDLYRTQLSRKESSEAENFDILVFKLHKPDLTTNHVHRQRLIEKLDDNRQLPLQLVIAPAGYGKSTLVACWLDTIDWPASYFSIDQSDNDLRQFLMYITYAIHRLFPDTLVKTSALLNYPKLPPNLMLANTLLTELETIGKDFILVLDDFHLIKEKSIHDLISELLRYPPQTMHLIIVSRMEPFLPLMSLRTKEKVNEIRLLDLKFTEQETGYFLQQATQKEMTPAIIKDWAEKTEGWITGLYLAVLSMVHRGELHSVSEHIDPDAQYVMQYLFSEILAQQESGFKEFLIKTSILKRFCGPLCDAVNPIDSKSADNQMTGWDFIRKLKNDNLFLINLDDKSFWFRYHHLFQKLLHNGLTKKYSQEVINELYLKASQWFEGQDLIEEAIQYALKSGDENNAARILEQHRRNEQDQDRWRNVEKWLALVPEKIRAQRSSMWV